jgi:hypothetical protein
MGNRHRSIVDIDLGGRERHLRFTLNAFAEAEQRLGLAGMQEVLTSVETLSARTIRTVLRCGLLHEEPDLTEEEVGSWDFDVTDVIQKLMEAITLAFGTTVQAATAVGGASGTKGNGARPRALPAGAGTGPKS